MAIKPIEIVLSDPEAEFSSLYRYAKLLDKHPILVSMPVLPGFKKAVVVAAALQFAVRLDAVQPDQAVIDELMEVLDFYLHNRTVRQPIEFFHSSLYALYHRTRITLWDIHGVQQQSSNNLQPECIACAYLAHCGGFFKSPRPDYACDGVKMILNRLSQAAAELRMSRR